MYYNRKISDSFASLIESGGDLRWLFDFVKNSGELDFLIGKNNKNEWISVYRGLSRIMRISPTCNIKEIRIDANKEYKHLASKLSLGIYGDKPSNFYFKNELAFLLSKIGSDQKFFRYYNNKKEGYFQNVFSRRYGILGQADEEFVIIDKEAVIGYDNQKQKDLEFGVIQKEYKELQSYVSAINPKRYGKFYENKSAGNELDFIALDKDGNLLVIEFKDGSNTSGIYLSPMQIGIYFDLFNKMQKDKLSDAILEMLEQKQKIGLINPKWPKLFNVKDIKPVLIISEYNYRSSAKKKFDEVLLLIRNKRGESFLDNLKVYNYTLGNGLCIW